MFRKKSNFHTVWIALITLFSFSHAHAVVTVGPWIPIFRGVDRAKGAADASEPKLQKVNVLRIDLTDPDLELFSTPSNGDALRETTGQTTSEFLTTYGLQAAVNANFFSPVTSIPNDPRDLIGLAISQGQVVSPGESGTFSTALIITRSNVASIVTNSIALNVSTIYTAVGGAEIIVRNGSNVGTNPDIHPRTVAGISQNGRPLPPDLGRTTARL